MALARPRAAGGPAADRTYGRGTTRPLPDACIGWLAKRQRSVCLVRNNISDVHILPQHQRVAVIGCKATDASSPLRPARMSRPDGPTATAIRWRGPNLEVTKKKIVKKWERDSAIRARPFN